MPALLQGCEFLPTELRDLKFVSLRPASDGEKQAAGHSLDSIAPTFVLTFESSTDLHVLAREEQWGDAYVAIDTCPRSEGYFVGFSVLMDKGESVVRERGRQEVAETSVSSDYRYEAMFVYEKRRRNVGKSGPDLPLPDQPHDLCFWVEPSGFSRMTFTSATGVIPKAALLDLVEN